MKALIYPKKDRITGIYAYCQKCKTSIGSGKCQKTKKRIQSCEFTQFHTFRASVVVPHTGGKKRKKKILNTCNLIEALQMKKDFEQELHKIHFQTSETLPLVPQDEHPTLLIEAMDLFVRYLHNDGVEEHKKKVRSAKHIGDVERYFKYFCICLKAEKIDHTLFKVEQLNDKIVGLFHTYLIEVLNYQNKTYNKAMSQLRQFVEWLIQERDYIMKNPFKGVTRKREAKDNTIITQKELKALLKVITPENSIAVSPKGYRRLYYREWVKTAFLIALETGLRQEEFARLRFSDIQLDEEGTPFCIRVENYKVNRILGNEEEATKDMKTIPITIHLQAILKELEFDKYIGTNRYLIAPDEDMKRETVGIFTSKAFTHFWKCTGINRDVRLKHLRKTYLTSLVNYFGDKATIISDHADIEILKKHYTNNEVIMKANRGFRVFD